MNLIFAIYDIQKGCNYIYNETYQNDETDSDVVKRILSNEYEIHPSDMEKYSNYTLLRIEMKAYGLILSENFYYIR